MSVPAQPIVAVSVRTCSCCTVRTCVCCPSVYLSTVSYLPENVSILRRTTCTVPIVSPFTVVGRQWELQLRCESEMQRWDRNGVGTAYAQLPPAGAALEEYCDHIVFCARPAA
jgi:hypothetical protein